MCVKVSAGLQPGRLSSYVCIWLQHVFDYFVSVDVFQSKCTFACVFASLYTMGSTTILVSMWLRNAS